MRNVLGYIIALLLILPFHSLKYVKTVLHVVHHDHDHDHHHEHDSKEAAASSHHKPDQSHHGAANPANHNHDRDVWGLFAHPGLTESASYVFHRESIFQPPPLIPVNAPIRDAFLGSLLRPPIAYALFFA